MAINNSVYLPCHRQGINSWSAKADETESDAGCGVVLLARVWLVRGVKLARSTGVETRYTLK